MKAKKKNRILPLIILLVILAALAVGYKLLADYNNKETETEDTSVSVLDKSDATVTALSYDDGQNSLSFTLSGDTWKYDGDENFPVDQEKLSGMATALAKISAESEVNTEDADSDEDFGLSAPALTARADFSDGTSYTYLFGDVNSYNGFQYFSVTGNDGVFMLSSTVGETFVSNLSDLFSADAFTLSTDSVTADSVSSITVATADGKSNEITDAEGISKLFDLVYAMNLSDWEDYYADSEEMLDSYGISEGGDRVTVSYDVSTATTDTDGNPVNASVPATYTVYLGLEFEDAEDTAADTSEDTTADTTAAESDSGYKYFYSPEGSTVVYSIGKDTVDQIFDYLTYTPAATTAAE